MPDSSSPLVLDSLQRRMKALESLYEQAVTTMDLSHVNHFEREGVLPIAFSLYHYLNMHDASFMLLTGVAPIWNAEWQARVQMAIDDHGKHRTVDEMAHAWVNITYMDDADFKVEVDKRKAKLAATTAKGAWFDYVVELYTHQARVMPASVVDEMHLAVRKANPGYCKLPTGFVRLCQIYGPASKT